MTPLEQLIEAKARLADEILKLKGEGETSIRVADLQPFFEEITRAGRAAGQIKGTGRIKVKAGVGARAKANLGVGKQRQS